MSETKFWFSKKKFEREDQFVQATKALVKTQNSEVLYELTPVEDIMVDIADGVDPKHAVDPYVEKMGREKRKKRRAKNKANKNAAKVANRAKAKKSRRERVEADRIKRQQIRDSQLGKQIWNNNIVIRLKGVKAAVLSMRKLFTSMIEEDPISREVIEGQYKLLANRMRKLVAALEPEDQQEYFDLLKKPLTDENRD